jgi:hypothetical protein
LKLNGTYQLLVNADVVNMLGGSVHAVRKNPEALVVESQVTNLEVKVIKLCTWSYIEIRMQDEITI